MRVSTQLLRRRDIDTSIIVEFLCLMCVFLCVRVTVYVCMSVSDK